MRGPNACSVQLLQAVRAWTLVPARHAAPPPPQRLYYKMRDQRDAKGRASGTLTCQMVAAALLPSCHWGLDRQVIRGRNICHSARMVCCPISGLGALIWKRQNTRRRTFVVNRLVLRTCELERASERASGLSSTSKFAALASKFEYGARGRWGDFSAAAAATVAGVCAYGRVFNKSFTPLSSHTNIPLTKKVCRLSESRKIF